MRRKGQGQGVHATAASLLRIGGATKRLGGRRGRAAREGTVVEGRLSAGED